MKKSPGKKLLYVVNVDWFFISHRLPVAVEAMSQGYEVHIATGITDKAQELIDNGLILHPLNIERGSVGIWNLCIVFGELLKVVRAVRPDILHLVTIKPNLLGGLVARLTRVPSVVVTVPGLGHMFIAKGLKASLRRSLIELFYCISLKHKQIKIIFQNSEDRALLSRVAKLKNSQTEIIRGSGVDLSAYPYSPFSGSRPVIMYAARLLKDKGVQEFYRAACLIRKRSPQLAATCRFVLVGAIDPPNPSSLTTEELDDWEKSGVVEVWGYQKDMANILARASIVVLPSYREGLPKVLIEAAACGRAVVTTDAPGCRDAIEPDNTGILVKAYDELSLADGIERMLVDPELRVQMGRNGREFAERVFDIQSVIQRHLSIYSHLLSNANKLA